MFLVLASLKDLEYQFSDQANSHTSCDHLVIKKDLGQSIALQLRHKFANEKSKVKKKKRKIWSDEETFFLTRMGS